LHRHTASGAAIHTGLLIARVFWAKLLGAKIVWTVHNLRSHNTAYPAVENRLWKMFVPLVDACIHLSNAGRDMALESFPGLGGKSHSVIPHGHYRECYRNESDRKQARLLLGIHSSAPVIAFVGQIKPYKNVSGLIRAFLDAADPRALLLIAGRSGGEAIEAELRNLAQRHPRILFHFGLIPDNLMHLYLNASDLTVFPYRDILNSGSAILALSFNKPALVPGRGAMAELRDLAGPAWVYTYEGELNGAILSAALGRATAATQPDQCDLSALSWQAIASGTLAAYRALRPDGVAASNPTKSIASTAPAS
jgi:glycosyltransferase involved in cell wall biosynthesis